MREQILAKLENSLHKGFINQHRAVSAQLKPKLLTNKAHENVLSTLLQELKSCKTFYFSVAFITEGGLATLKTMLFDLQKKGIKGRILTSTFLNFNSPKMFKELLKLKNVEVRLTGVKGFHSKGYIFEHQDYYSLIVGSSNLTDSALKANFEWNIFLTSMEEGEVINHFKNQFEEAWEEAIILNDDWIAQYKQTYVKPDLTNNKVAVTPPLYVTNPLKEALQIQPNKMQSAALKELQALRGTGAQKGLVISATGTGKTYLSAFDVRNFAPKRMLFIVHREQILKKAMKDYRLILGGHEDDFGLLSSNSKNYDAKYLFATVQTLSSDRHLQRFAKDSFDYILIDEVHRSGATSYQTVMNYFTPKFLLGMTATPERSDGFNIYELFDYNIAYEIRLQAALEEDMLCPFHYFGVTDYEKDGETITEATDLQLLVSNERVHHILEKIKYYGYSGERLRGLMFCSSVKEAQELSTELNKNGLKTLALSGSNDQKEREEAVEKLNNEEIQYILTVDIFNEGVDIPFLNQIVMLRQTQSSIIFIQQLGRGLRKHDSKDYVTIIDFIGNYTKNYLIPIALSGDQTLNKDNIRRKTVNTDYIQGVSTINFEEIAKKRIFDAITNTSLSQVKFLREHYIELKNRLGHIPTMLDFLKYSVDPEVIIACAETYYDFLLKVKESIPSISEYERGVLAMLSKDLLPGKRAHEIILLKLLLEQDFVPKDMFEKTLKENQIHFTKETIQSVENVLSLKFYVTNDRKKFGEKPIVLLENGQYRLNDELQNSLRDSNYKQYFSTILDCGLIKNEKYNKTEPFTLYEKYSRREVCRLLNWGRNEEGTLNGGRPKNGEFPIFVNYHKTEENSETNYMDEFLSTETFRWCTTKQRKLTSSEVVALINEDQSTTSRLFVKKENGEGKDFYYLGTCIGNPETATPTTVYDNGKDYPVVTIEVTLQHPIQHDIYHYLVEE